MKFKAVYNSEKFKRIFNPFYLYYKFNMKIQWLGPCHIILPQSLHVVTSTWILAAYPEMDLEGGGELHLWLIQSFYRSGYKFCLVRQNSKILNLHLMSSCSSKLDYIKTELQFYSSDRKKMWINVRKGFLIKHIYEL